MEMHQQIKQIINPVYVVGGSVRDELLGLEPKDWDFTTSLSPDEIEQAIRSIKRKPYLIGKRFGTIGIKIDGKMIEITTFRTENYVKGCRKPQVEFVRNITEDLSRRDFTINAIAKRDNRYIDPFEGRKDITEKIIKCVGLPKHRFKEDPLRMLRAARFASQLEFSVDNFLEETASKMSHKILEISRERWVMEIDKLLMTDKPSIGLDFMARTRLLNFMIPELSLQVNYEQNNPHHDFTLWEHTKKTVDNSEKNIEVRWACLLHDIAKPFVRTEKPNRSNYIKHDYLGKEIVIKLASYLKWSNNRRDIVSALIETHLLSGNPVNIADERSKLLTPTK